MTVPNALDVLRQVRKELGDRILLGAGTVLDPETARAVFLAGAEFIVAPTVNLDVIRLCQRYDKLVMPGAFTPTEILTAWEAGRGHRQGVPGGSGRPGVLQGDARTVAADSPDADRRRRSEHRGGVPQGRRVLPRRRRPTGRSKVGRRTQLHRLRELAKQYVAIVQRERE